MSEFPKIVSVDDHVVEPPNLWQDRLPAKYRDAGPRVIRTTAADMLQNRPGRAPAWVSPDDTRVADWWVYEDLRSPLTRAAAAAGFDREEVDRRLVTYEEMRPGAFDTTARLQDMDVNWVEASLCFPTFPRFCGQTFLEAKDRELAELCVRAYNDWMVEEWCGASGGRLIPLCLVPLWDPELAAAEVRRNAARGVHAVCFSELPANLGLPSIHDKDRYWDPFFAACHETGTVVCIHIGSGSRMPKTSDDAPAAVPLTLVTTNAVLCLVDWLFSGLFVRFPSLTVALSEGQVGWIPYSLQRADTVWVQHRAWAEVRDKIPDPPSTYFYRNMYGCIFDDAHGLKSLDDIHADRVTFETDYPHSDGTWPNSKHLAQQQMAGLPDDVTEDIIRGNAIRMLSLDLA